MKYKCGCTADGDNVANYCPIHGEAEDRSTVLLSFRSEFGQVLTTEQALVIVDFVACVESLAEKNMLKTGKLEGAHYAAMKQLLKQVKDYSGIR
jgi:hypothetical protein